MLGRDTFTLASLHWAVLAVCMMLGLGLLSANLSSILLCGVGSPKYDIPVPPIWLAESSEVTLNPRERGAKQGGALPTACRHRP